MSTTAFRFPLIISVYLISSSAYSAVNFEKDLLPVITKKCMDCHKAPYEEKGQKKTPKAGLRLDASWAILKGSEDGPVLTPGSPDKSGIYESVTLPKDDDGHMPSKGEDMTKEEIALLKTWIEEGANFGGWIGSVEGMPAGAMTESVKPYKPRPHDLFYAALEKDLKPLSDEVLANAKAAGAQVSPVKVDSPLVRVDFLTGVSKCDDAKVAAILPLKENIVQLDLGRTIITDAALKTVAQLPRLVALDLRQTKITDAGLESLSGLKKLESLNLYGTEITDAGLKHLAKLKSLKNVYLWQSKATKPGVNQLNAAIPGLKASIE
ncbi:c-type cytochrome domain-containing protein [Prosthecobacter sp.]|uniref:c-type cytochrome domain-containing protein n=1 Tax=Prosthecobacter sp. TaxID=1965333 RepID=UPI0025FEB075|nr:c-type cytochrome domain-containing protein [Prosthecobacter sp.]